MIRTFLKVILLISRSYLLFFFAEIKMLKLGVVFFLALSTTVHSQCFYKNDGEKKLNPAARTSLYRNQLDFTLNLFNIINKAVPDDNIFFSPFSVYHALLLAYFAAGGQTEKSLKQSLRISDELVS